jgi:hypothetical protein
MPGLPGSVLTWRGWVPVQVQDAGLIFLSRIASSVVMLMAGQPADAIVATSLVVRRRAPRPAAEAHCPP